jgi:hypothetical protein
MGVFWIDPIGVADKDSGAPGRTADAPLPCPGVEEGPDTTVVRPGSGWSDAGEPYDPPPVRRHGCLGSPRTLSRPAAPAPYSGSME